MSLVRRTLYEVIGSTFRSEMRHKGTLLYKKVNKESTIRFKAVRASVTASFGASMTGLFDKEAMKYKMDPYLMIPLVASRISVAEDGRLNTYVKHKVFLERSHNNGIIVKSNIIMENGTVSLMITGDGQDSFDDFVQSKKIRATAVTETSIY